MKEDPSTKGKNDTFIMFIRNCKKAVGGENFYKASITAVPCYDIEFPKRAEPIEIENSLGGWRLKIGRKAIDCSSEVEARYLRVFAEIGWG